MASYLRPRRGKKATAISQNITLKAGEVFFETPTGGVGTGAGRIMMGDGSNNYTVLNNNKRAFITDINCPDCYISNFTATDGDTTLTNNTTYLNNMKPGATASTFFSNVWKLLSRHNKQLAQLNKDLSKYLSNVNWNNVIINTNTGTQKAFTVNISDYSFLSLELWFLDKIIDQIILPKDNYNLFRNVSVFVDTRSDIAIGQLFFTSKTSVNAWVSSQVNGDDIYIKLRGIKNK